MASLIPSSGPVKFSDIENEFGQGINRSMGDYRRPNEYGDMVLPIAEGIPTSGQVSFNQFRGKEVTLMVDCYSGDGNTMLLYNNETGQFVNYSYVYRVNAKNYFTKGKAHVVGVNLTKDVRSIGGGFGGGKEVIIHVNRAIGSEKSATNQGRAALVTGKGWDAGTKLRIEVGGNGAIMGGGGDGGHGGSYGGGNDGKAFQDIMKGTNGTSGLGIQWSNTEVTVMRSDTPYRKSSGTPGFIAAGLPGGGGGSGSKVRVNDEFCGLRIAGSCIFRDNNFYHVWAGGGGGGGGAGWPNGEGGARGVSGGGNPNAGSGVDGDFNGPWDIGVSNYFLSGGRGGSGATNSLVNYGETSRTATSIGGQGGQGGTYDTGLGTQDGADGQSSPSCGWQGPDIPSSNKGCGDPGEGADKLGSGYAIVDGGYTGDWSYGTWNDGSRVFGGVTSYLAA